MTFTEARLRPSLNKAQDVRNREIAICFEEPVAHSAATHSCSCTVSVYTTRLFGGKAKGSCALVAI